jgi:hypothetical protein
VSPSFSVGELAILVAGPHDDADIKRLAGQIVIVDGPLRRMLGEIDGDFAYPVRTLFGMELYCAPHGLRKLPPPDDLTEKDKADFEQPSGVAA